MAVCGNRAKNKARTESAPSKHENGGDSTAMLCGDRTATAAAARADWILHCVTLQPPNTRRSAKSLAYRSSELVARFSQIEGYKCLSLPRALDVVKCQLALV
jgi:hypothetical protein